MSKVLLTGASGYVGNIIVPFLQKRCELYMTSRNMRQDIRSMCCDLSNINETEKVLGLVHPDIVIHAAGNKNLRFCEEQEQIAYKSNVLTVKHILEVFNHNVRHIYISSDYVFDGSHGNYTESDEPRPCTVYGHQKLEAEKLLFEYAPEFYIIRLSALFDKNGTFPTFLRERLSNGETVDCNDDIFYSPTYYRNFLVMLGTLLDYKDTSQNIFHCSGERVSRFEFASLYAKHYGFPSQLIQRSSLGNKNPFLMPDISLDSSRSFSLLGIKPLPLKRALEEL